MGNYREYMLNFSMPQLKGYLGDQIVETLIEWSPNGEANLTKTRLITMIDCLYGSNIFKQKKFRKDLLLGMKKEDIIGIRDACLSRAEKAEDDVYKLVDLISDKPWSNNTVSKYLLSVWGLDEHIFDKENFNESVVETVDSSDTRFFELLDYQYCIKQRALHYLNSGNMQERMFVHMPNCTMQSLSKECKQIQRYRY